MNTLKLNPSDVLFFRDGRPMEGASSGHGAAWPMPHITDAALHAALHRAGDTLKNKSHSHSHWNSPAERNGATADERERPRLFGSLVHAGPFPVHHQGEEDTWYFPRPLDLLDKSTAPRLHPLTGDMLESGASSLPAPLKYPVANKGAPEKETKAPKWLSAEAYASYLKGENRKLADGEGKNDAEIFDAEYTVGIGIDSGTQTQDGQSIYSAQYLRLRDSWSLGLCARSSEKQNRDAADRIDILPELFEQKDGRTYLSVGGQQRLCTCEVEDTTSLPFPQGMTDGFTETGGKHLVKWILLTPAIFPPIEPHSGDEASGHIGGWLPNWVADQQRTFDGDQVSPGDVMLLNGPGKKKAKRKGDQPGQRIDARLVAALTGKPEIITGWALPNNDTGTTGGAKPTLLAVPAGSIYYFETESPDDAQKLATTLNWHGVSDGTEILNRRSTLMGEKGYGLGICGTWQPYVK